MLLPRHPPWIMATTTTATLTMVRREWDHLAMALLETVVQAMADRVMAGLLEAATRQVKAAVTKKAGIVRLADKEARNNDRIKLDVITIAMVTRPQLFLGTSC